MKNNWQNNIVIECMTTVMQESVSLNPVLSSTHPVYQNKISRIKIFSTGAIQYIGGFSFLYTEVNQTFQMSK